MTVEITNDHRKLLARLQLRWEDCEFGAPAVDCKRPYGNSSVYIDMAEILGVPVDEDDWDWPQGEVRERFDRLHADMLPILQQLIAAASTCWCMTAEDLGVPPEIASPTMIANVHPECPFHAGRVSPDGD